MAAGYNYGTGFFSCSCNALVTHSGNFFPVLLCQTKFVYSGGNNVFLFLRKMRLWTMSYVTAGLNEAFPLQKLNTLWQVIRAVICSVPISLSLFGQYAISISSFVVVVLADHHWFTFLAVLVMMLDQLCLNYVTLVDPQLGYWLSIHKQVST